MSKISDLMKEKEEITQKLEDAILEEVVAIAKKMNLDSVMWHSYGTKYVRDGKEIESKRLDRLDGIYCDHVHAGGLEFYWDKEKGFHS